MIDKNYVLITRIPVTKDEDGRYFSDPLWVKDLYLHTTYLENLRLCCPVVSFGENESSKALTEITNLDIKEIISLRIDRGWLTVAWNFLPNFLGVIRACRSAEIVHSGGAGWAFPLSFYVLLLRPIFSFKWFMVIESSFWKLNYGERFSLRRFASHHIHKWLLTRCVRSADARLFTHSGYKKLFLDAREPALIAPATWIDAENILSREDVLESVAVRQTREAHLRFIFPSRLTEGKGVLVVLKAAQILREMGAQADLTIIGEGPLEELCKKSAMVPSESLTVTFRKPVGYGDTFFRVLRENDVMLVANLSEEQPRIIFDAFSQGLAVIASDTLGIKDVTADGKNAFLFKAGDPKALADAIMRVMSKPALASELGLNGLEYVRNKTHANMHLEREKFLKQTLVC